MITLTINFLVSIVSGNEAPIALAGPVHNEVGLAMTPRTQDIQAESNEADGQVRK